MVSAGFCHLLGESLRQMGAVLDWRFPLPTFLCGEPAACAALRKAAAPLCSVPQT